MKDVAIIGVASGAGARDPGCADGPDALIGAGPIACLYHDGARLSGYHLLRSSLQTSARADEVLAAVVDINQRVANEVQRCLLQNRFPLVVGGDHSCAIGTWSGVHAAAGAKGPLGLLWVDAHMDSHVPATSPSGALHGMPLACLLGQGIDALVNLGGVAPKFRPAHVCLFGVRSFEPGEAMLLARFGVRVIFMDEIARRGFTSTWRDALAHVTRGTAAYGITIDLDAVDPRDAPGVGTPAPGGIGGDDLVRALADLHDDARLLAVEIAEYNPHHDRNNITLTLLRRLLCAVSVGGEHDEPHDRARTALLRP